MLKFPKSPLPKSRSLHLRAIFSWIILLHVETTTITHIQIYWIRIYYSFCNSGFFYLCPRNREWCWRKWNKVIETYSVLKKFNNGCCNNKNLQLIKKDSMCFCYYHSTCKYHKPIIKPNLIKFDQYNTHFSMIFFKLFTFCFIPWYLKALRVYS